MFIITTIIVDVVIILVIPRAMGILFYRTIYKTKWPLRSLKILAVGLFPAVAARGADYLVRYYAAASGGGASVTGGVPATLHSHVRSLIVNTVAIAAC